VHESTASEVANNRPSCFTISGLVELVPFVATLCKVGLVRVGFGEAFGVERLGAFLYACIH
jgi:hypothetical protein